jgi:phosphatidylinositol-3-phosphatase
VNDHRRRRPVGALGSGAGLLCCLLVAGCGSGTGAGASATHSQAAGAPSPAHTGASRPKILVIMEENHSLQQVFPGGMPYLWSLARRYGYATDWSDVGHPSLPNYLAIFAGSSFNNPADCAPARGCTYPAPTVFGQALARGETARAYEESMPQPCDLGYSGNYDVNHNPWAYFPAERASCRALDVPAGTPAGGALASAIRAGTLPNIGLLTPNLMHDGHDGSLAQADAWLHSWIPVLTSGPDWRSGRLVIVVVFDEGETTEQVPFVLMDPRLHGAVLKAQTNQYALTRLIDGIMGAAPLRHAASAAEVAGTFGLRP